MIHVPYGHKTPKKDWLKKAKRLSEKLDAAATKEERNKIIDDNRGLWAGLRDWLLSFSNGKCWFSEARDTFSYMDVEHFRPKKSAMDLEGNGREGYWWLAFDWHNFRICGNVGNRKKGTFFPLAPGCSAATCDTRHLVDDELCVLLDPTKEGDPELVAFDERGIAKPSPGIGAWPTSRAETSIKRYKLNDHEPLREARQKVWQKCRRKIEQAREALQTAAPSSTNQERQRRAFQEIREMLNPDEPFTCVVRECLSDSGFRWAQRIASETIQPH